MEEQFLNTVCCNKQSKLIQTKLLNVQSWLDRHSHIYTYISIGYIEATVIQMSKRVTSSWLTLAFRYVVCHCSIDSPINGWLGGHTTGFLAQSAAMAQYHGHALRYEAINSPTHLWREFAGPAASALMRMGYDHSSVQGYRLPPADKGNIVQAGCLPSNMSNFFTWATSLHATIATVRLDELKVALLSLITEVRPI